MQILKPIVHETIWGGSRLTPYSGGNSTKIGHLYSAIDTAEFKNEIVAGSHKGQDLHQWFLDIRDKYGLQDYEELPVLMALVEAKENLSIQVHPDDVMAKSLENKPFGKNESFYTLIAPTCGKMYNGCKAQSVEEMNTKISEGKIAEALDMMPCESGDYVYITGGTLHAATAGSLHFEIEENCEKTYRFYDFDRVDAQGKKRPLQLDKALACLDCTKKSVARKYGEEPIEERMYSTQLVKNKTQFTNPYDMFVFAVMLKGDKNYEGVRILPGTAVILEPGESIDVADAEFMIAKPKRKSK